MTTLSNTLRAAAAVFAVLGSFSASASDLPRELPRRPVPTLTLVNSPFSGGYFDLGGGFMIGDRKVGGETFDNNRFRLQGKAGYQFQTGDRLFLAVAHDFVRTGGGSMQNTTTGTLSCGDTCNLTNMPADAFPSGTFKEVEFSHIVDVSVGAQTRVLGAGLGGDWNPGVRLKGQFGVSLDQISVTKMSLSADGGIQKAGRKAGDHVLSTYLQGGVSIPLSCRFALDVDARHTLNEGKVDGLKVKDNTQVMFTGNYTFGDAGLGANLAGQSCPNE